MKEIESNKNAWGKISEEHYHTFKDRFKSGTHEFNEYILRELGDLTGKKVIHLQCNTGADTLLLARTASQVTGVDLVPDNIVYAKRLAGDLGCDNVRFIEHDIMTLAEDHKEKYDVVFTSEGVLGWLPDLGIWAKTVRGLLNEGGYLYVFDSHPFFMTMDESKLSQEIYDIKYPYFGKVPDVEEIIGGYAAEVQGDVKAYFWMHTMSELINSLSDAGLHMEYFNEYTENFFDSGNMQLSEKAGLYEYDYNREKFPMSYSLKASIYHRK